VKGAESGTAGARSSPLRVADVRGQGQPFQGSELVKHGNAGKVTEAGARGYLLVGLQYKGGPKRVDVRMEATN